MSFLSFSVVHSTGAAEDFARACLGPGVCSRVQAAQVSFSHCAIEKILMESRRASSSDDSSPSASSSPPANKPSGPVWFPGRIAVMENKRLLSLQFKGRLATTFLPPSCKLFINLGHYGVSCTTFCFTFSTVFLCPCQHSWLMDPSDCVQTAEATSAGWSISFSTSIRIFVFLKCCKLGPAEHLNLVRDGAVS